MTFYTITLEWYGKASPGHVVRRHGDAWVAVFPDEQGARDHVSELGGRVVA